MMPPLPHPSGTTRQGDYIYLGEQMRAYGQACADAERERLESVEADLLAFAQRVCFGEGDSFGALIAQGKAAIAKATGETP